MSKNRTFTGPLAEHIQNFLNEKRSLGYKYEEQERILYVLDQMSKQFDCSNGLPEILCLAFVERNPNWRQKTQEQRVTLIRTFAEYLIRHEIPAYLVDFSIVTNRNEDFKPYIFTHSQITDIFNAADSIRPHSSNSHIFYPSILRIQYGCGLLISETLGLRMKDVDMDKNILHVINAKNNKDRDIPVSDSVMEYIKWYGRKARSVPLMDKTTALLENYLLEQHLDSPSDFEHPLFYNSQGKKLTRQGIAYILKKYAAACDIKEISPHKMRHTKAMHLTEAEVNPIFIRDFLGHTDLKVTEVYSKTSIKKKKAALDKMKSGKDVIPDKPVKDWTEDQALLDWLNGLKH